MLLQLLLLLLLLLTVLRLLPVQPRALWLHQPRLQCHRQVLQDSQQQQQGQHQHQQQQQQQQLSPLSAVTVGQGLVS
jgi:hypothetical protein